MPSSTIDKLFDVTHVRVLYHGRLVGTLARPSRTGVTFFQYDESWLKDGFSISPLSLPLEKKLFQTDGSGPDQLFGVFSDSLPDDWGRYVMDRRLAAEGLDTAKLTEFSRLALVGRSGLGALEYEPEVILPATNFESDFDELSRQCRELIDSGRSDKLDTLYRFGSSSGGARPKVMVDIDGEPWIVKFPTSMDGADSGKLEYCYAKVVGECGIDMAEVRLLPSTVGGGFFATKRFDRRRLSDGSFEKIHMASAAALLEASPFDVMDYADLMRLSMMLTNNVACSEQLYRVMCFNVYAGNCDDHSRNFSFLHDARAGEWRLSPAYDLTRNDGFMGEHATLINGKASGMKLDDLIAVGVVGGLAPRACREIAVGIEEAVAVRLQSQD